MWLKASENLNEIKISVIISSTLRADGKSDGVS